MLLLVLQSLRLVVVVYYVRILGPRPAAVEGEETLGGPGRGKRDPHTSTSLESRVSLLMPLIHAHHGQASDHTGTDIGGGGGRGIGSCDDERAADVVIAKAIGAVFRREELECRRNGSFLKRQSLLGIAAERKMLGCDCKRAIGVSDYQTDYPIRVCLVSRD